MIYKTYDNGFHLKSSREHNEYIDYKYFKLMKRIRMQ